MRGKIIHYNGNDGKGLIAAGESQLAFDISLWSSDSAPAVNQTVEISTNHDGAPTRIVLVDAQTLAKEKFRQFAAQGGNHGQQVAFQARALLGRVASRMGTGVMIVCAVLFIAWFLFPVLSVNTGYDARTYSVSEVLGLDFKTGSSSFGFWSFLGLVAVVLPWLASWFRARWAAFLYCAPLLMIAIAYARMRWEIHEALARAIKQAEAIAGTQAKAMVQGMVGQLAAKIDKGVTYEVGLWIVLLLGIYLVAMGIKRYVSGPEIAS